MSAPAFVLPRTAAEWQAFGADNLPGLLGIEIHDVSRGHARLSLNVERRHMAGNGFLHAGTVVSLADTACGYGCLASLPAGAKGFTTIELKSNHLGTAVSGVVEVVATAVHLGRTTHVWDATVTQGDRRLAMFRCTQLVLSG